MLLLKAFAQRRRRRHRLRLPPQRLPLHRGQLPRPPALDGLPRPARLRGHRPAPRDTSRGSRPPRAPSGRELVNEHHRADPRSWGPTTELPATARRVGSSRRRDGSADGTRRSELLDGRDGQGGHRLRPGTGETARGRFSCATARAGRRSDLRRRLPAEPGHVPARSPRCAPWAARRWSPRPPTLRSILQLAAENQIARARTCWRWRSTDGERARAGHLRRHRRARVRRAGCRSERRRQKRNSTSYERHVRGASAGQFWAEELSPLPEVLRLPAACPLCYCSRCTIDCNQPQWIPVASHALGNLEWNMVRAMHLAGRCVNCGDCGRACPVGIPLYLLNHSVAEQCSPHFGFSRRR